jgi:hypothetical protein
MDGSCRADSPGALAGVFGVRFAGSIPLARVKRESAATLSGEELPPLVSDSGISLDGGHAAGKSESSTPIFIVHKYGQGTAILLNALARDYQIWRTAATEMVFRDAFGQLLADAGVEPFAEVKCTVNKDSDIEHAIQVTEIHRYRWDGARYVGFLRHAKLRPDGVVFMADLRAKPVWIQFDSKWHVYEMRSGMYRGYTDTVEDIRVLSAGVPDLRSRVC